MRLQIHHIDGNPLNNDLSNLRRVRVATNTAAKRPPGRPPMAPGEAKTARIEIRTTAARKAKAERLAAAAGLSLSAWWERSVERARFPTE